MVPQGKVQDNGTQGIERDAQQTHPAHAHRREQALERAADDPAQVVHEVILDALGVREDVVIEGEVETRVGDVHTEEHT